MVVVFDRIEVVNTGPPAKRVLIEDIKDIEVAPLGCANLASTAEFGGQVDEVEFTCMVLEYLRIS